MLQIKKDNFINIIGLMSGTSLDGIDVSLISTDGDKFITYKKNFYFKYKNSISKILHKILQNYKLVLKNQILRNKLDNFVTKLHFKAIKKSGFLNQCDLVGFHGQTIYHNPTVISVQLGNPILLAKLLMKNVVFNFRDNDIFHKGQGAPLAPIYHKSIFKKNNVKLPSCFLNIGGISNITYWDGKNLIGFDTGPGNNLMDQYVQMKTDQRFDFNGEIASKGIVNEKVLNNFMLNDYFKESFPKSLDKYTFQKEFNTLTNLNLKLEDAMSTLAEFTFISILNGIINLPKKPKSIIISGGGHKNINLILKLKEELDMSFYDLKDFNHDPDFIESELIAFLSARHVFNLPITFPQTTGVSSPISGGAMYNFL